MASRNLPPDWPRYRYVRITVTAPRPCPGPPAHNCIDRMHPREVLLIPIDLTVHPLDAATVELVP